MMRAGAGTGAPPGRESRSGGRPLPEDPERPAVPTGELLWAATACREVAASVLQSYGAVGFALETGVHRAYRRAASLEVWVRAVVREVAIEPHGS